LQFVGYLYRIIEDYFEIVFAIHTCHTWKFFFITWTLGRKSKLWNEVEYTPFSGSKPFLI